MFQKTPLFSIGCRSSETFSLTLMEGYVRDDVYQYSQSYSYQIIPIMSSCVAITGRATLSKGRTI
jgi:hypothetical protein